MKFFGDIAGDGDGLSAIGDDFGFCIVADEIHIDNIASVALEKAW